MKTLKVKEPNELSDLNKYEFAVFYVNRPISMGENMIPTELLNKASFSVHFLLLVRERPEV